MLAFVACSTSHSSSGTSTPSAPSLPPLANAPTTLDQTIAPRIARVASPTAEDPAQPPAALADLLAQGYGDTIVGPGDPIVTQVIDGTTPPAPGPNAKRLLRFAHLADLQIADDESPTRLGSLDTATITNSALRPSDEYLCRMTNAAVRTINALHRKDAFAFTLMGGDIADSAQTNEIEWALGMLSGSPFVKCDSGTVDDPIPGPNNDGKDAFAAEGLAMPWKWVTGNHDVLVQGNFTVAGREQAVLGSAADGGTRDYANGDNGAIEGSTAALDPKRALLSRTALMTKVSADKDGHGLGQNEIQSGRATYTFDVDGTPLRFLILDTAHEGGDSEGVITQRQVDGQIRALLDQAKADGKWVVLASHHAASNLSNGGGLGGTVEPDALTTDQWGTLLGNYDNVLFSMVGHSHRNRVQAVKTSATHSYWEVMTAAIADWPHEFRTVEIYDQDNGWVMLRSVAVDFSTDGDPVAAEGKRRGTADYTSAWLPVDDITPKDKNVELWIKKP